MSKKILKKKNSVKKFHKNKFNLKNYLEKNRACAAHLGKDDFCTHTHRHTDRHFTIIYISSTKLASLIRNGGHTLDKNSFSFETGVNTALSTEDFYNDDKKAI